VHPIDRQPDDGAVLAHGQRVDARRLDGRRQ
jgi:hypothetical protein